MNAITKSTLLIPLLTVAFVGGGAAAGYASLANADTTATTTTTTQQTPRPPFDRDNHIGGTVTAVNGTTLTVNDTRTSTTYTVDVSTAKMLKFTAGAKPTDITASDIAVGDTVGIMGTVSGTTVTAQSVLDGAMPHWGMGRGKGFPGRGVMGTVSAVNGSTITITDPNGTTYTVDAGSATFSKTVDTTIADVTVGSHIGVAGVVSGTSVSATHVMTNLPEKAPQH